MLVLGTRQMLQRLPADFHVTLLGKKVTLSPPAPDLGLQVDSNLKPWSNGVASKRKLKTWVHLRLRLARTCVHLR